MTLPHKNKHVSPASNRLELEFSGERFVPLLSGALYWPQQNTLLVADLHLEKMSSFAKSGQLLPPYDTGATLTLLEQDIASTAARKVICLGDSFHRDEGTKTLCEADRHRLRALVAQSDWHWLSGNHDPAPHHLGGTCASEIAFGNLHLSHEPRADSIGQIAGHLHPGARIFINGRSTRRPCFVHDQRLMILPAYGVSTGTLNILSKPFAGLLVRKSLTVVMLGRHQLYPVATKYLK